MDPINLMLLNEAYRHGVYNEEVLSEEELVNIEEWVEALIEEGYDLDQYSDEELYEAYLDARDEILESEGSYGKTPKSDERYSRVMHSARPTQDRTSDGGYGPLKYNNRKSSQAKFAFKRLVAMGDPHAGSTAQRRTTLPRGDFSAGFEKDPQHGAKKRRALLRAKKESMREELDLYDIVSEYLVSEGFCDSHEDADVIMANMSEEWRESILEETKKK
jgi:hypothetical protein